jgi:hypothetical protein
MDLPHGEALKGLLTNLETVPVLGLTMREPDAAVGRDRMGK